MKRKLPLGIQTFRRMREENRYYVDKTAFCWRLVDLLAAVELFLDRSDEEDCRRWSADAELIVAGLEGSTASAPRSTTATSSSSPAACRVSASSSWASAPPTPTAHRSGTASPAP